MFPIVAAIGGIVKGVVSVAKGIGKNKQLKDQLAKATASNKNTGIAGQVPEPHKGFLGMFTGKKIIAKQQAQALADQVTAGDKKTVQAQQNSLLFGPGSIHLKRNWPWYTLGLGVLCFGLYKAFGKKTRGRKR